MGIIIEWSKDMIEHLDCIDPDNPEGLRNQLRRRPRGQKKNMITTQEWWHQEKRWVEYNVKCRIKRNGQGTSGGHIVVLTYKKKNNPRLAGENIIWGTNQIIIEPGKDRGDCRWARDGKKKVHTFYWKRERLYEERNHCRSTQQKRDKKFRHQIIDLDKKCVISHETTKAALDAAHIIPARKNGNEIRGNGIALRADIHRLYDRGRFQIDPETGEARIDPAKRRKLSEDYINLLENGVLPDATRQRVQAALQEVWGGE